MRPERRTNPFLWPALLLALTGGALIADRTASGLLQCHALHSCPSW